MTLTGQISCLIDLASKEIEALERVIFCHEEEISRCRRVLESLQERITSATSQATALQKDCAVLRERSTIFPKERPASSRDSDYVITILTQLNREIGVIPPSISPEKLLIVSKKDPRLTLYKNGEKLPFIFDPA